MNSTNNPPQRGRLEPEYAQTWEAYYRDPSPENASAFLKAVDPVLRTGLRSYGDPRSSLSRAYAKSIILDSARRYDPQQAKLRTYLLTQLQGLQRYTAQSEQLVRLPERVGLDLHRVRLGTAELRDRLGRDPSDAELAEHVGVSRKRLAHLQKATPVYAEGMLQQSNYGEPDEEGLTIPTVKDGPSDAWHDFIYQDLDPTGQVIMQHTMGYGGHPVLPKKAIASKLGISPAAVTQRAARIRERLDMKNDLASGLFS